MENMTGAGKFLPKMQFELAPLDLEAELLCSFSGTDGPFPGIVESTYPALVRELSGANTLETCGKFAEAVIAQEKTAIENAKINFEKDWTLVSDEFLRALSEHMETSWPEDKPTIIGYVSISPICPRFLDNYSFAVYFRKPIAEARVTIAHELVHFLWFKKWKEVFPEIPETEYETPHLVWRLSEVMDPIILHCHPKLDEMIHPVDWGYRSFEELTIGDESMSEHFANIYRDCMNKQLSFEQLLKIVWAEAQKHENILKQF
jgi:hypothetical protein